MFSSGQRCVHCIKPYNNLVKKEMLNKKERHTLGPKMAQQWRVLPIVLNLVCFSASTCCLTTQPTFCNSSCKGASTLFSSMAIAYKLLNMCTCSHSHVHIKNFLKKGSRTQIGLLSLRNKSSDEFVNLVP